MDHRWTPAQGTFPDGAIFQLDLKAVIYTSDHYACDNICWEWRRITRVMFKGLVKTPLSKLLQARDELWTVLYPPLGLVKEDLYIPNIAQLRTKKYDAWAGDKTKVRDEITVSTSAMLLALMAATFTEEKNKTRGRAKAILKALITKFMTPEQMEQVQVDLWYRASHDICSRDLQYALKLMA